MKVLARLVPSEASLLGSWTAMFALCPHAVFPWCVSVSQFPPFVRTPVIGLKAHPSDLVLPQSPLYRPCLQIQSQYEVLGVRTSTHDLGGAQFSS